MNGTIPDLTAIAPLLPGTRVPPLHDVRLVTRISDSGGVVPHVEAATLHLGAADLGSYVAGLRIVSVDIDAPQENRPVRIAARGSMADTAVTLLATLGSPDGLLSGQWAAREQVDVALVAADARLTVKGSMADPKTLSGADLAIGAMIPDLSVLSPLAHGKLPAVTQIAFEGTLTDAPGGFRHGATLHGIRLTTADGDLSGEIGVTAGPPLALTGGLHADRIDADALLAALATGGLPKAATRASMPTVPPAASPSGAGGTSPSGASAGSSISPTGAPTAPAGAPTAPAGTPAASAVAPAGPSDTSPPATVGKAAPAPDQAPQPMANTAAPAAPHSQHRRPSLAVPRLLPPGMDRRPTSGGCSRTRRSRSAWCARRMPISPCRSAP